MKYHNKLSRSAAKESADTIDAESVSDVKSLLEKYIVSPISGKENCSITDLKKAVESQTQDIVNDVNEERRKFFRRNLEPKLQIISDAQSRLGEDAKQINSNIAAQAGAIMTAIGNNSAAGPLDESVRRISGNIAAEAESIRSAVGKTAAAEKLDEAVKQINSNIAARAGAVMTAVGNTATAGNLSEAVDRINGGVKKEVDSIRKDMATSAEFKNAAERLKNDIAGDISAESSSIIQKLNEVIEMSNDKTEVQSALNSLILQKKLLIASLSIGIINMLGIIAVIVLQLLN